MLKRVKNFLNQKAPLENDPFGEGTSYEIQLAVAIVLLELAVGDEDLDYREKITVRDELKNSFGINRLDALRLLKDASYYPPEEVSVAPWIGVIVKAFNHEQKKEVLKSVWRVIHADGVVERYEQAFAESICKAFGISETEHEEIKKSLR